ncbi:alpha/beta hydrolase-fold protein [Xanthobacter sp. V0B-10]|uniref:alpha/beta hydrolase n=1 Tax=Xanthobacter albus TaxID=3119929 RepID=UPI0037261C53
MMKRFLPLRRAGALLLALAAGLGGARAPAAAPLTLPGAEERTVVSKAGLAYRIFIALPREPPPPSGYPVLYVLDGNAVAGTLSDYARTQARSQGGLIQPAVLVAVGYPGDAPHNMPRRARDLTPAPATAGGSGTYLKPEDTGFADAFLAFLVDELRPAIAADFPTDPARQGLMGHSFGGLFTLHALFTRPAAFSTYVAASPSLWWADGAILKEEDAFAAHPPQGRRRLLVTVGGQEQQLHPGLAGQPQAEAVARRLAERRMVDSARELSERLAALPGTPVAVRFEVFPGQTHASAAPHALLAGLEFFLGPQAAPERADGAGDRAGTP